MVKPDKHSLWLRVHHWLNVPLLLLMIWSGLLIYWANDVYWVFFPTWFYKLLNLQSQLADGLSVHFLVGWFFILNGIGYIVYLVVSGHWRELFPTRQTVRQLIPTILHDLGLREEAPPHGKFNAAQSLAYTSVILFAGLAVMSGFAIYKPVQLHWLTFLFGGYEVARGLHFLSLLVISGFIFVHIVQVIRAGWPNFRAMVAGTEFPEIARSRVAFSLLIAFLAVFSAAWIGLRSAPNADETPAPFRKTLELNGKIWKAFYNSGRQNVASTNPSGKVPRVNGDIGLGGVTDRDSWELLIDSNADDSGSQKLTLHMKDILALPRTETATEFKCIEGWSQDMSFAGVKFSDLLKAYNIQSKPYVGLVSSDGEYYVSIDIESMMHDQTLLAYEMNGAPLKPENGAPLRLVIPIKYGIKNLKHIGKIFFSDVRPPDYWAEQGYDWYAGL